MKRFLVVSFRYFCLEDSFLFSFLATVSASKCEKSQSVESLFNLNSWPLKAQTSSLTHWTVESDPLNSRVWPTEQSSLAHSTVSILLVQRGDIRPCVCRFRLEGFGVWWVYMYTVSLWWCVFYCDKCNFHCSTCFISIDWNKMQQRIYAQQTNNVLVLFWSY